MAEIRENENIETPEEDTRTEPHPAALLWMLWMGRRNDPDEKKWK